MFIIMAHRSARSMLGSAASPCKGLDGNVLEFATREEAEREATKYQMGIHGPNVWYTVLECPE